MEKLEYEIRRDGITVCRSTIPLCGYSVKVLRDMVCAGYKYYTDGKWQRKI